MSIAIKVREYLQTMSDKIEKSIEGQVFNGHIAPSTPRELWLLPPHESLRRFNRWIVVDKKPTSIGWIHVKVLEEETK
jgi:hypothetical protein